MAYATGKYSYGLCDYCGQRYPYNVLKKNWRGFKVCPEDYEPKEPQLEPLKYRGDAVALLQPRPDRVEPVDVYVGQPGFTYFQSVGSANNVINMRPYPSQDTAHGVGEVGNVFIRGHATVALTAGVSATAQVGTSTAEGNSIIIPFVGSASGSGVIGTVAATGGAPVSTTGVDGTASVNPASVSLVLPVPLSSVGGSGSIGEVVVPDVSFIPESVEGSGDVGDPSVTTT